MRKEMVISFIPREGNSPGRIKIHDPSPNDLGEHIDIVPYRHEEILSEFFLELLKTFEFLGWKKKNSVEKTPQGGLYAKMSLK